MLFSYLFIACSYFSFLILLIVKDKESSLKDPIHFRIAILASVLWPVVMPLSLLELKAKANRNAREEAFAAMPKPVSMTNGEIRYIKTIQQADDESSEQTSSPMYGA